MILTILEEAKRKVQRQPQLRLGQAVFNIAYKRNAGVVRELCSSVIDPFYDDKKVTLFLSRLREQGVE